MFKPKKMAEMDFKEGDIYTIPPDNGKQVTVLDILGLLMHRDINPNLVIYNEGSLHPVTSFLIQDGHLVFLSR